MTKLPSLVEAPLMTEGNVEIDEVSPSRRGIHQDNEEVMFGRSINNDRGQRRGIEEISPSGRGRRQDNEETMFGRSMIDDGGRRRDIEVSPNRRGRHEDNEGVMFGRGMNNDRGRRRGIEEVSPSRKGRHEDNEETMVGRSMNNDRGRRRDIEEVSVSRRGRHEDNEQVMFGRSINDDRGRHRDIEEVSSISRVRHQQNEAENIGKSSNRGQQPNNEEMPFHRRDIFQGRGQHEEATMFDERQDWGPLSSRMNVAPPLEMVPPPDPNTVLQSNPPIRQMRQDSSFGRREERGGANPHRSALFDTARGKLFKHT